MNRVCIEKTERKNVEAKKIEKKIEKNISKDKISNDENTEG
jgi:hypothetical protein